MNAMMLLKAMSEIAPEDIEAAMQSVSADVHKAAAMTAETAAQPEAGSVIRQTRVQKAASGGQFLRYSGWIAAAACLLPVLGIALLFGMNRSGWMQAASSSSEQIMEITATKTESETTVAVTTAVSALQTKQTVSGTTAAKPETDTEPAAGTDSTAQTGADTENVRTEANTTAQTASDTQPTTTLPPDTTEPPRTTTAVNAATQTETAASSTEPVYVYTLPEVEILNPFENGGMEPNSPADVIAELNEMPEGSFVFRQFREPEEAYNTHLRNHLEQNRDVIAVYTVSDKWTMELHSWEVTGSGKLNLLIAQPDDGIHMFVKGVYVFLISKPDGELPEINEFGAGIILYPVPEVQE